MPSNDQLDAAQHGGIKCVALGRSAVVSSIIPISIRDGGDPPSLSFGSHHLLCERFCFDRPGCHPTDCQQAIIP